MPVVSNTTPGAIESGSSWNGIDTTGAPVIVTFSFPTAMPAYDQSIGGFTTNTISSFTAFTPTEQTEALGALGQWAAASGIVFVEVAPGQGDITFANVDFSTTTTGSTNGNYQNAAGIGFYPFGDWSSYTGNSTTGYGFTSDLGTGGAVFMNSKDIAGDGTVNLGTLLHEIGHAIGMKHPDQAVYDPTGRLHDDVLDPSEDSSTITIMSETGDAANAANPSLFNLDKLAAADLYGPAGTGEVVTGSTSGSNSVSMWSWDATTSTLTQTAVSANETIHGTSVDDVIYGYDYGGTTPTSGNIAMFGLDGTNTLYAGSGTTELYGGPDANTLIGGAGNDSFYVYSNQTTVTDAYTTGNNTLYAVGVNYTLPANVDTLYLSGPGLTGTGNGADDSIFGDGTYGSTLVAGSGNDYIVGGAGNDTIVAGPGADEMFGGPGVNTFVFDSTMDQNSGAYIGDFVEGTDKIDLTGIAKSVGHPLTFIGSGPFTDQAGQVESYVSGNATFVEVDTTGTGTSDFQIVVYDNAVALQAGDFNLACYCAGTHIMTDHGEVPVEELAIGERVLTVGGALRPIRWIGQRAYARPFLAGNRTILPVCFRAGSLASQVPARDLWVSPNHAMLIEGLLIQAADLVNGETIVQPGTAAQVRYFHIELDSHDAILAEGAWSETFLGDDGRMMFHNAHEYYARYPGAEEPAAQFCAPRVTEGHELQRVREQLAGLRPTRRGGRAA